VEATIRTSEEHVGAKIKTGQETKVTVSAIQEKMETAISSIWSQMEETIKHQMEDILVLVDQQTWGLHEELGEKIEQMQ
jgi:hypothetical protein